VMMSQKAVHNKEHHGRVCTPCYSNWGKWVSKYKQGQSRRAPCEREAVSRKMRGLKGYSLLCTWAILRLRSAHSCLVKDADATPPLAITMHMMHWESGFSHCRRSKNMMCSCGGVIGESSHEQTFIWSPMSPARSIVESALARVENVTSEARQAYFPLCTKVYSLVADVSDGRKQRIGDDASQ
jgi:hypothetical protein